MDTQQERINKLIQALKLTDKLHLKDAASLLDVSEMTIRRDLNNESSSLVVLGGYVVIDPKNNNYPAKYFVSDQQNKQVNEKLNIAKLVAPLISENDTVFFDCGTTMPFIIDAISDELSFNAVCYSLNAFLGLQTKPNCKTILCGGQYNSNNAIFTNVHQQTELSYIRPNKAFISAAGISIKHGVTCFNFDELMMKKLAISNSCQKYLIADSSKFDKVQAAYIDELSIFDYVITDKKPEDKFLDFFNKHNINVVF